MVYDRSNFIDPPPEIIRLILAIPEIFVLTK